MFWGFYIIKLFGCQDYKELSLAYRPSHADATYDMKYGVRAVQVLTFATYYNGGSGILCYHMAIVIIMDMCLIVAKLILWTLCRVVVDLLQEKPLEGLLLVLLLRKSLGSFQELMCVTTLATLFCLKKKMPLNPIDSQLKKCLKQEHHKPRTV